MPEFSRMRSRFVEVGFVFGSRDWDIVPELIEQFSGHGDGMCIGCRGRGYAMIGEPAISRRFHNVRGNEQGG